MKSRQVCFFSYCKASLQDLYRMSSASILKGFGQHHHLYQQQQGDQLATITRSHTRPHVCVSDGQLDDSQRLFTHVSGASRAMKWVGDDMAKRGEEAGRYTLKRNPPSLHPFYSFPFSSSRFPLLCFVFSFHSFLSCSTEGYR